MTCLLFHRIGDGGPCSTISKKSEGICVIRCVSQDSALRFCKCKRGVNAEKRISTDCSNSENLDVSLSRIYIQLWTAAASDGDYKSRTIRQLGTLLVSLNWIKLGARSYKSTFSINEKTPI